MRLCRSGRRRGSRSRDHARIGRALGLDDVPASHRAVARIEVHNRRWRHLGFLPGRARKPVRLCACQVEFQADQHGLVKVRIQGYARRRVLLEREVAPGFELR